MLNIHTPYQNYVLWGATILWQAQTEVKKKWKALLGQIQNTIGKSQKLANTIHLTRIYMIASSQPVAVNTVLMPKHPFS